MNKMLNNNLSDKQGDNTSKQRNSNIEWLRIISMLLIIATHAARIGYTDPKQPFHVFFSGVAFASWALLGVDLFVIISAWYLSDQVFRLKKVISIVFQAFTWVLAYVIICFFIEIHVSHYSLKTIAELTLWYFAKAFFQPFWCRYYWFVTAYFFLLLIFPFLNKLLNQLQRSQIKKVLIVFSFVPIYAQFFTSTVLCDVFCFAYVYLLVGYIKRYGSRIVEKYSKPVYYISIIAAVLIVKVWMPFIPEADAIDSAFVLMLESTLGATGRHSIILRVAAVLIFFSVIKKKPTYNKAVNIIASHTLGVYLFHESAVMILPNTLDFIIERLTAKGFLTADMWFPLRYIGAVAAVFAAGIVLEIIRNRFIQKPFMNWVSVKWQKEMEAVDCWFNDL